MPQCKFTITGNIKDFTRLDNIYKALLREASKLLTGWEMSAIVNYSEKQDEGKK